MAEQYDRLLWILVTRSVLPPIIRRVSSAVPSTGATLGILMLSSHFPLKKDIN